MYYLIVYSLQMNPSSWVFLRVVVCDRFQLEHRRLVSPPLACTLFLYFFYLPCSSLALLSFIKLLFAPSDVYENVYFHCLILYIWFSFVLCHSIAIIIDVSSHVV